MQSNDVITESYSILSTLLDRRNEMYQAQMLLDGVLELLSELTWLHADGRGALLLLNTQNSLVMVASKGFGDSRVNHFTKIDQSRCACLEVARTGREGVHYCVHDSEFNSNQNEATGFHYTVPIFDHRRIVGVMPIFMTKERTMSEQETSFLHDLGNMVSSLVQQFLTDEQVALLELDREEIHSKIIEKLGTAAEYRDTETGMHIMRMKEYAGAIAKELGLADDLIKRLVITAPMHDVGKIGIPDDIMLKPGKLGEREFKQMKTHTLIGATILQGEDTLLHDAQTVSLTHHEKWDGSGYPKGLAGEEIPIFGRICAVADVFDALSSERPYKKAWSLEDSLKFMRDNSSSHFDPNVVDAFFKVLPEILRIKEFYRDEIIDLNKKLSPPAAVTSDSLWFPWIDDYSIDIDIIDEHHRYLFHLTNELHTAVADGLGCKAVGRTLNALEHYVRCISVKKSASCVIMTIASCRPSSNSTDTFAGPLPISGRNFVSAL